MPETAPPDIKTQTANLNLVEILGSTRPDLVELIPEKAQRILDIGCGNGEMGYWLKQQRPGCEVVGIELNPAAAEIARERLDQVVVGNVEDLELEQYREYFDCIVYGDILEHLPNPWLVVARQRDWLKPGGVAIANIPNVGHYSIVLNLLRQRFDYTDNGIMLFSHLRFFTRRSSLELFRLGGYGDVKIYGNPLRPSFKRQLLKRLTRGWTEQLLVRSFIIEASK